MTTTDRTRRIDVGYLARVEGEGSLRARIVGGRVEEVEFSIFEPPRFFEGFLRGRRFGEAPDITARICGICPIAYQMSSVHAMEDAAGVEVTGALRDLRLLLYCGEWIESHGLHVYLLHAPDFLGYESAIHMAADHADLVQRGLTMKQAGNALVTLIGGREIHPINVKVGGFYRVPARPELEQMRRRLENGLQAAIETVDWVAGFEFPDLEMDWEMVAVGHPEEYPFLGDRVVSTGGLDIPVQEYAAHFVEEHVERSNALHSRIRERGAYHVGPLARYTLHSERLAPEAAASARRAGLGPVCRNPYRSIVVRAVETVHAFETALTLLDRYEQPAEPAVPVEPRGSVGHGVSEAPRGLLYHRYAVDGRGLIADADIVPPTSQNQLTIEQDLTAVLEREIDLPDDELTWLLEQTIRNYDPCISCATHFLRLKVEREP